MKQSNNKTKHTGYISSHFVVCTHYCPVKAPLENAESQAGQGFQRFFWVSPI
jgi:hypothetical protein